MEIRIEEALRYLGAAGAQDPKLRQELEQIAAGLCAAITPRRVYRICSLTPRQDGFYLPEADLTLSGETAARMLDESVQAVLLACTLGTEFDAMLRAEQARSMARAVMLDACGSALVEAACDAVEAEVAALCPHRFLTDRFSPGYGDLPLSLQPRIISVLDAQRRIGISVGKSFLMNPCKSVTAVIGLAKQPQAAKIRGCAYCSRRSNCTYRTGGQHCGN